VIGAFAAAAAMVMPGGAMTADVTIPARLYAPRDLQALVGQPVTWANQDVVAHTVTADDGSFDSGSISPSSSYEHTFDRPGTYAYHCTIHAQMRGVVHVSALGLTGPERPKPAGSTATLRVLAPAGTMSVTLERLSAAGAQDVAVTAPDSSGHAAFQVPVAGPARYLVQAGDLSSAPLKLAARPAVVTTAKRHGRRITARVTLTPALGGASVALEHYVRERFDYRPLATTRLRHGATVVFHLRSRHYMRLRGAVVKAPGGWSPGGGRSVRVRALKR
jgi:plastocyanin